MPKEAIILAGGIGSRLHKVISQIPKPMAPIGETPFLSFLLTQCQNYGITHVILAVGYKHETIVEYYGKSYKNINISYAVENERLGTGGGLQNALIHLKDKNNDVLILNGDSILALDFESFTQAHIHSKAPISIALKPMTNFDRYGTVSLNKNRITDFKEKELTTTGCINTGIYLLNPLLYLGLNLPIKHSFETDFLAVYCHKWIFNSFQSTGFFIDIGIPEDYKLAKKTLKNEFKIE